MRGQRAAAAEVAYVALCAALIGWGLGYALPAYARLPSLFYDPQPGRWVLGARPGPIAMGYYGQILYGLAGALLAAPLGALVGRRRGLAPGDAGLLAAWTLAVLALVGAWFTWNNWP